MLVHKVEDWRKTLLHMQLKNNRRDITPITFYFKNNNILEALQRDTGFLSSSALRKYIPFSKDSDPLLLFPYRQLLTNRTKRITVFEPVIKLFELNREVHKRLQQAEIILKEELILDLQQVEDQPIEFNKGERKAETKQTQADSHRVLDGLASSRLVAQSLDKNRSYNSSRVTK